MIILTDNAKVVNTLNSFVWNGQSLFALKDAMVRNIKEYNDK
jgi:hypothetical protein